MKKNIAWPGAEKKGEAAGLRQGEALHAVDVADHVARRGVAGRTTWVVFPPEKSKAEAVTTG